MLTRQYSPFSSTDASSAAAVAEASPCRKRARSPSPPVPKNCVDGCEKTSFAYASTTSQASPAPPHMPAEAADPFCVWTSDCRNLSNYVFTLALEKVTERRNATELASLPSPMLHRQPGDDAPNDSAAAEVVKRLLEPSIAPPPPTTDAKRQYLHSAEAAETRALRAARETGAAYYCPPAIAAVTPISGERRLLASAKLAWREISDRQQERREEENERVARLGRAEADLDAQVRDFYAAEQRAALEARKKAEGSRCRKAPMLHHFQQRRQVHTLIDPNHPTRPIVEVERMQLVAPASAVSVFPETRLLDCATTSNRFADTVEFLDGVNARVTDLALMGLVEEHLGDSFRVTRSHAATKATEFCLHAECTNKRVPVRARGLCDKHRKQLARLSKKAMKS